MEAAETFHTVQAFPCQLGAQSEGRKIWTDVAETGQEFGAIFRPSTSDPDLEDLLLLPKQSPLRWNQTKILMSSVFSARND